MVEVKNFHFLKRPFLTKKGKWFFVTLRGGRGGVRASVTFVTKKMVFFLKASLTYERKMKIECSRQTCAGRTDRWTDRHAE